MKEGIKVDKVKEVEVKSHSPQSPCIYRISQIDARMEAHIIIAQLQ